MIFDFIYDLLNKKLQKKKHDVCKLQWEKAQLEATLEKLRAEKNR